MVEGKPGEIVVRAGKHRNVQTARTGGRKLFRGKRREDFLEWFAATCNVKMSAEKAGIAYQTVFKHRLRDAAFADAWDRALAQGYARLEAKLIETRAAPIEIDGDWEAPEMENPDPDFGLRLLKEHASRVGRKFAPGEGRKPGHGHRIATDAEIRAALEKALKTYAGRVSKV